MGQPVPEDSVSVLSPLTKGPTHSDGSQQSLGHVGHDDADEEDDGLQPAVAQAEGQDEEGHAQEHGHARDQVDEVLDLHVDGRLARGQPRGQRGDAAHHRVVARGDDDAVGRAW